MSSTNIKDEIVSSRANKREENKVRNDNKVEHQDKEDQQVRNYILIVYKHGNLQNDINNLLDMNKTKGLPLDQPTQKDNLSPMKESPKEYNKQRL